ncbi:ROK family transcriptional regulator [Brooklawnia cerclae]|uniref:NBD/HSP70 family sugar kinase n=1 Tax=Brooklawnia cerclae TaxID=349934 RepID=A0ABX0SD54_9ACTN|nr:ROK family transcriptional regulator [Brooklawnia cerclae]NIH56322.1 putative NBD/HSP70 family sugar kinase [Brooklawnia cerclae]
MTHTPSPRAARQRWSTASELLRLVHAEPGITRTQASDRLRLSSGASTELIERLRDARLLSEERAEASGRGRPTTLLAANPQGPLVVVVDLNTPRWRVLIADLTGNQKVVGAGDYGDREPAAFLSEIADIVATTQAGAPRRVRAVVAVVAGLVSGTELLQFTIRGWNDVDLGILTSRIPDPSHVQLIVGNDATLSGLAEARTGAARSARVALHILIAVGLGGTILVDGQPVTGAHGAAGEFGHLPFGDPTVPCPCGAYGCWDLMIDGRALARNRGDEPPSDPIAYAQHLLDAVRSGTSTSPRDKRAVDAVARALGAGIAGLVNIHDPEIVTIGGLATGIRAAAPAAFDDAYERGLMAFHRRLPPPIRDSVHQADGPVRGAIALAIDEITTPSALAAWEASNAD